MNRRWMNDPLLRLKPKERFSRAMAWCWLVENACWKDTEVEIEGRIVLLKRGQLSYSIRFLAEQWNWNKSKVVLFLNKLENNAKIETQTDTGQTVITICNYNEDQLTPHYYETQNETQKQTAIGQFRDTNSTNKNTENTTVIPDNSKNLSQEILEKLKSGGISESEIKRWFGEAKMNLDQREILLPNQFIRDQVNQRFDDKLHRAFGFMPELKVVEKKFVDKSIR